MPDIKHIMIADDDKDDVDLFHEAIKACALNIHVSTAENGEMLLHLLEIEATPDFIILDLNMPRMNGIDCLKAIRKKEKFQKVPIMILSTSTSPKEKDSCFDNGADYFKVKPVNFHLLTELVKNVCKMIST